MVWCKMWLLENSGFVFFCVSEMVWVFDRLSLLQLICPSPLAKKGKSKAAIAICFESQEERIYSNPHSLIKISLSPSHTNTQTQ